jgi:ABC-type multidrug transport system fused ATPase/permease subunit
MSSADRKKNKSTKDFWRACRFLWPHRGIVIASFLCAIVVGASFVGGLSTMLPIINVLVKGDSVQAWVDRQIVADRLGVRLMQDDPRRVKIIEIDQRAKRKNQSPAADAGVPDDTELVLSADLQRVDPDREKLNTWTVLSGLADPAKGEADLIARDGKAYHVRLRPVEWYHRWARRVASYLPTDPVWTIAAVFGVLASLALFGNFMKFWQEYLASKASILAVNDIRRKMYDHVLHIPLGYFGQRGTSDVTSRLVQDTGGLMDGFRAVLGNAIQEPINATFTLALALAVSWKLTLFVILFAPILFVLIKKFGKKMRRANRSALERSSSMLSQLEGTLIGIRVVKATTAERHERRRYREIMRGIVEQNLRMSRIDAMSSPVMESLTLVLAGVIIIYAAYLVLRTQTLEVSQFIMVMACLAGMADSLRKITKVSNALQKSNAAAARVFETLAVPIERERRQAGRERVKLPALQREVRFEELTFAYPGAQSPAVDGVSLVVPKGQSVAVVGRNGSGKTTLLALLPRFYDPQAGRITIDGVDIRHATLRSLREQIAIVTQDSVIFPGSILENIAYGTNLKVIDRNRAMDAARRAFAHDFILEKPNGYDTVLGEHGAQLSGGQKQRLCIARAIYRETPILILDEATSQVDAESEHLIQQAIEQVMHERTTFVIAHRFSTILSADVIVVMERGRVVGQGKHEELLANCPTYQQLYERQLIGSGAA